MPLATPAQPAFAHPVRVYWEDTDAGGIVFYANYLKFFERARTEWLRALGWQQQALREQQGLMCVVSQTAVRYLAPARLDDELQVSVQLGELGRASLVVAQQAWRGPTLLAEGTVRVACADAATLQPRRWPAPLLATLRPACNNPLSGGTSLP
jgi:acyl-CoA thioester hydrolase